jgi:hypothetical protein
MPLIRRALPLRVRVLPSMMGVLSLVVRVSLMTGRALPRVMGILPLTVGSCSW